MLELAGRISAYCLAGWVLPIGPNGQQKLEVCPRGRVRREP